MKATATKSKVAAKKVAKNRKIVPFRPANVSTTGKGNRQQLNAWGFAKDEPIPTPFYLKRHQTGRTGKVRYFTYFNYHGTIVGHVPMHITERGAAKRWLVKNMAELHPDIVVAVDFFR